MNRFKYLPGCVAGAEFSKPRKLNLAAKTGASRPRTRLFLEVLETRLAPAVNLPPAVFVVPVSQPEDGTHVHDLGVALTRAGEGGLVTIEPGATPDPYGTLFQVTQNSITIQGNPNVPTTP